MTWLRRYYHWLHGQWPAGEVEKLPLVGEAGTTNVPGLRVAGDLAGVPLLKFAADSAAAAVQAFQAELKPTRDRRVMDIAIIGGGVAGLSAALEAQRLGLSYMVFEAARAFNTLAHFPQAKPIFTYPVDMEPRGGLQFNERCNVKEGLLNELEAQREAAKLEILQADVTHVSRSNGLFKIEAGQSQPHTAHRVLVAIGRSGNHRQLQVPGEELAHVANRLHDANDFVDQRVVVVGGGDSAAEAALALSQAGAHTTLIHRGADFHRVKPEIAERLTAGPLLQIELRTRIRAIDDSNVTLDEGRQLPADHVFVLIGREPPLDFCRRSGVALAGEWNGWQKLGLAAMLLFSIWLYHWKAWLIPAFGVDPAVWWSGLKTDTTSFMHTLSVSASQRSFYYALAYCLAVTSFGWKRVKRRRTAYVQRQTLVLACIQWCPLFILPELLLPWCGRNEWFTSGMLGSFADAFFPSTDGIGLEREYWRAYGFILAWPLFVYNWFTEEPLWGWLIVGCLQTFVLIPWMVRRWGKGAYCGWICSCGALAETMGDAHRQKMPHGPRSNRWNMIGQMFLAFALMLMALRVAAWCGFTPAEQAFTFLFKGLPVRGQGLPLLNYAYFVDLIWAGVLGVAFYFHYSGRVWCRFACPLAALMHLYARFSRFRIFAEKAKCISCNVCTSVCHQGIDVMAFASRGRAMQDPQCVRCSACVQQCPTGVLTFGRLLPGQKVVLDDLSAKSS
jgi:NosR/NirI family transcriptional regulator, nitrous oxide reductase regulator